MKEKTKKILSCMMAGALSVTMVLPSSALYAVADVDTGKEEQSEVVIDNHNEVKEETKGSVEIATEKTKASLIDVVSKDNEIATISLAETTVATVGGEEFDNLEAAVAAAKAKVLAGEDAEIVLQDSVELTQYLLIQMGTNEHKLTLNLNQNTLTVNTPNLGLLVYNDLTIKNGNIDVKQNYGVTIHNANVVFESVTMTSAGTGVSLYHNPDGYGSSTFTLDSNSSITATTGHAIYGAGKYVTHTINVDGTITAQSPYAAIQGDWQANAVDININENARINGTVQQMSNGAVTVSSGAVIKNDNAGSGITMTKGSLYVEDGATIEVSSPFEEYKASGSGHVSDGGPAIFIEPTSDVEVTIDGGKISSANGAAIYAPKQGNDGLTLEIFDGTFSGNADKGAVNVDTLTEFISGGSYSSDISEYVEPDTLEVKSDDTYYVGWTASDAMENAEAGTTFTVLQSDGEDIHVPEGVTVDNQSGDNVTVNGKTVSEGEQATAHVIATVDNMTFDSLQAAVRYAQETGEPVILQDDVEENTLQNISITDDVVIDLNQHTVTFKDKTIFGFSIFNGHAEFKNGTIKQAITEGQPIAINVFSNSQYPEDSSVTLTDVDIYSETYAAVALTGEASYNTSVNIDKDSTITNTAGHAIAGFSGGNQNIDVYGKITASGTYSAIYGAYNAGPVNINIHKDAVVNGQVMQMSPGETEIAGEVTCEKGSAVTITNGSLTVKDTANIRSNFQTSEDYSWSPSDNYTIHDDGSALFIEGANNVNVNIEGGNFYSAHTSTISGHKTENTELAIKGGTFGGVSGQESVTIDSEKQFISGGIFNSDIKKYITDESMELQLKKKDDSHSAKFYVGPDAEEAISNAKPGDSIEIEDAGNAENITVPSGVTVKNNTGNEITVNDEPLQNGAHETIMDPAELSYKVSSEVTNHWETFDEGFASSGTVMFTDILGYIGPNGEIKYTITITNKAGHMASKPFTVEVTLPDNAFSNLTAKHPTSGDKADLVADLNSNKITWNNVVVPKAETKDSSIVLTFTATVNEHPTTDRFNLSFTANEKSYQYKTGPYLIYGAIYDPNGGKIDEQKDYGVYHTDENKLGGFTFENGIVTASIKEMTASGNFNVPEKAEGWEHVVLAGWSKTKTEVGTKEKPEDLITDEFTFNGNLKIYAVWALDGDDDGTPYWDDLDEHHTLVEHPRVEPTCTSEGNIQYWSCSDDGCGKYFDDANGEHEIQLSQTVLEKKAHTLGTHEERVEPTYDAEGMKEYWQCSECEKYFTNQEMTEESSYEDLVLDKLTCEHADAIHEFKAATCEEEGYDYWRCPTCGKLGKTETFDELYGSVEEAATEKLAHKLTKHNAVEATCEAEGNIDYWTCDNCNKVFKDDAGKEEIDMAQTVTEKLAHQLTKHDAVEATCEAEGNIDYWTCDNCNKVFKDNAGKEEIDMVKTATPKKDHVLVEHPAVDATCDTDGNTLYYECQNCHKYFSDNLGKDAIELSNAVVAKHHTALKHVEKKDATETEKGNIEYWYCEACDKYFDTEALDHEITAPETIIPATACTHAAGLQHVEKKDATCKEAGNVEYWYCETCGKYFTTEEATEEIPANEIVVAKLTEHQGLKHVEKKDATAEADGNIEYWYCEVCDKYFSDASCEKEITKDQTVVKYVAPEVCKHKSVQHVEKKDATAEADGNIEYWYCPDCEKYFSDADLTKEITKEQTVVKYEAPETCKHENVKHVEKKDATAEADGNIEYWYCEDCDKYFSDVNLTKEITKDQTVIKYEAPEICKHENVKHVEKKEATKDADGNIEYWYCEVCGKYFSDVALTKEITKDQTVVKYEAPAACKHENVQHVLAKSATKDADGNIEYWYCETCGKYFSDAALTKEITKEATVVKYTPPTSEQTSQTTQTTTNSTSSTDDGKGPGTVQTGDYQSNGLRFLLIGLAAIISGVGVVALKGKKKKEE